ncbi:MAG: enoyl-CoA hydratase-related protein [Proteobacteria bacterium]|nr:enoyl-CoA hydratase-related protein [Pseudomonadota bacterium]
MYKTIKVDTNKQGVTSVTMARPDVHNAFNAEMIIEMTSAFVALDQNADCKIIVLQSEGESFSAGADINWMKSMVKATQAENQEDSLKLAALMRVINFCGKPVVAKVQGLALGGGVGLIACCDIVIANEQAKFGLTEAKLGLVPAVISPYVVDAITARQARRYFQTAEIFTAQRGLDMGLLSEICPIEQLDELIAKQIKFLLSTGPSAKLISKKLVQSVVSRTVPQQKKLDQYTTQVIASVRVSAEGQHGLTSFLDKKKPKW